MSKPPLFFIVIIGLIVVAASFRFMQQRREKADNDMAPLQQKLVVVSNKREKPINDRRSRQQEVTPAGTSIRYEASFKPQVRQDQRFSCFQIAMVMQLFSQRPLLVSRQHRPRVSCPDVGIQVANWG